MLRGLNFDFIIVNIINPDIEDLKKLNSPIENPVLSESERVQR